MKRQVSTQRQPWIRAAIYSFMTLTVTVIVALLMLLVLGYQFNKKDGKIEQGGLLQFESIPTGAAVTLDQVRQSSVTNTKATVDRGSHFVTYDLAGYRQWKKSITVGPGQIGWLSYARLIPQTITPETEHTYPTLTGALATYNDKYMLLHEAAESPTFVLVNIQNDTPQYSTLTLPAGSYSASVPGKAQSFTLDSWSEDDQAILVRHTYDDTKQEWLLLDRNSPEKSVNITASYGIDASHVQFAGTGHRLLFVQVGGALRRINLDEQTLSRPLVTNADTFSIYDDKTVVYATAPDAANHRTVGYAAVDIASPVTIATYPADGQPLYGTMAKYFGKYYVAISYGQQLVVQSGNDLPSLNNKGTLKTLTKQTVASVPSALMMSHNDRFIVATLADGYATYDLDLQKYDKTTWAKQPQTAQPLHWLDDYMLWANGGGQLRFYEFDGANQQTIMPVAEGFDVSLTPNDKYVYAVSKTDAGYALVRARLVLK